MRTGEPSDIDAPRPDDPRSWAAERLTERRRLHTMVNSGLYRRHEVLSHIEGLPFDLQTRDSLRGYAFDEVEALRRRQESSPGTGDCERLDSAFATLHEAGICAVANAGIKGSEAFANVLQRIGESTPGYYSGYCYYHLEDIAWCLAGRGLMVSFGSLSRSPEADTAVAQQIVQTLQETGLSAHSPADGDRIWLCGFTWHRTTPWA